MQDFTTVTYAGTSVFISSVFITYSLKNDQMKESLCARKNGFLILVSLLHEKQTFIFKPQYIVKVFIYFFIASEVINRKQL